jgi:hypothetical protein
MQVSEDCVFESTAIPMRLSDAASVAPSSSQKQVIASARSKEMVGLNDADSDESLSMHHVVSSSTASATGSTSKDPCSISGNIKHFDMNTTSTSVTASSVSAQVPADRARDGAENVEHADTGMSGITTHGFDHHKEENPANVNEGANHRSGSGSGSNGLNASARAMGKGTEADSITHIASDMTAHAQPGLEQDAGKDVEMNEKVRNSEDTDKDKHEWRPHEDARTRTLREFESAQQIPNAESEPTHIAEVDECGDSELDTGLPHGEMLEDEGETGHLHKSAGDTTSVDRCVRWNSYMCVCVYIYMLTPHIYIHTC